jgi:hypothetical protein
MLCKLRGQLLTTSKTSGEQSKRRHRSENRCRFFERDDFCSSRT